MNKSKEEEEKVFQVLSKLKAIFGTRLEGGDMADVWDKMKPVLATAFKTDECDMSGLDDKQLSLFIKCIEYGHVTMNDDDNVCIGCGSKNTYRLPRSNELFTRSYPQLKDRQKE